MQQYVNRARQSIPIPFHSIVKLIVDHKLAHIQIFCNIEFTSSRLSGSTTDNKYSRRIMLQTLLSVSDFSDISRNLLFASLFIFFFFSFIRLVSLLEFEFLCPERYTSMKTTKKQKERRTFIVAIDQWNKKTKKDRTRCRRLAEGYKSD
jgi:hypothetical protein